MDDAPVRTLAADLRDVERYQALRAALVVVVADMETAEPVTRRYWRDRLVAILRESEPTPCGASRCHS